VSDAAIAHTVTGLVTITTIMVGFLTLWIKLKYGFEQTSSLSAKTQTVEDKIDANTQKTEQVDTKTDLLVERTNGVMDSIVSTLNHLKERVDKLEEYNHISAHRILDAINAMHLKMSTIEAYKSQTISPAAPPATTSTPSKK
jgi:hypothetical protein